MNCSDFINSHHDHTSSSARRIVVPVTKAVNPTTSQSELYAATALTFLATSLIREENKQQAIEEIPQKRSTNGGRTKKAVRFPVKLMKVLSMEEYNRIITWTPSGKSFVIIRPKSLVNRILPKYFKKSVHYSSFTRKLRRWGFDPVGDDKAMEFSHKEFLQGRVDLAEKIICRGEELPKKSRKAIIAAKQMATAAVSPTLKHTQKQPLPPAVQETPRSKKVTKPNDVVSLIPSCRNTMVSPAAGMEARRLQEWMQQRTMESQLLCAQERAFCALQRVQRAEQRFMEMESRRVMMIQNSINAHRTFPGSLPPAGLGFRDFLHYPQL